MIIPCFRCGKKIDTPDASNADYVMAGDTSAKEPREVLVALKHNQVTLAKEEAIKKAQSEIVHSPPTEDFVRSQFQDNEFDAVEVPSVGSASKQFGEDLVKVVAEIREKDIQKTGIVCPGCHKPTDFVIWGVHKSTQ